jgi:hypothetical protein
MKNVKKAELKGETDVKNLTAKVQSDLERFQSDIEANQKES